MKATMQRVGDHWDVYVGDAPVLVNESYQVASNAVACLNDPRSEPPTTEVAEICDRIARGLHGRRWFGDRE